MWSDATDEARLYRLWRDGSGTVAGQIFEAAGQRTLAEADRFASPVAAESEPAIERGLARARESA